MRQPIAHRLFLFALLLSLGIGALFARAIWTMRNDEWESARQINANVAHTLDHAIATTIESFDHSLQGVVDGLANPKTMALSPELRSRVLFDNSLRTKGIGSILVLDADGKVLLDSESIVPRKGHFADREYFRVFREGTHHGLFVGVPLRARLNGYYSLPLARAFYHPDGRFAGVVAGTIRIDYFRDLFGTVNLGSGSSISLYRTDGTLIARFPHADEFVGRNIADTVNWDLMMSGRKGSFTGAAVFDGMQRLYAFQRLEDFPLLVTVAQSVDGVLADWRRNAALLGGFALGLMLACLALVVLFARELEKRQQVSGQLQEAERDMRTIMDNLPSMVGYWDARLRNRFANNAYLDWFGMGPEQLRGKHISELLGAELYTNNRPYLEQALLGHAQMFERTIIDPTGTARHGITSYTPDFDGEVVRGIFVQVTDITERKRMEEELFQEKERMRLTLQSIGDAVVCTDALGRVSYLNPVAQRMTGWQAFDAAGRDVDEVAPLYLPNGAKAQPSPLRQALDTQTSCGPTRGVVLRHKDGQRFEVEESASPIIDRSSQLTGAVMVLHDVTETMAMAERMAHLAQYDALTDLPNRLLLQDRAQLALAMARRQGKSLAVMYLDLDGFKQINDTLGHDVGDQLLVQFARRLVLAMRQSDTVCRQGGDEFVVLLPGLESPDQASVVARKVLAVVKEPFVLSSQELRIGLSAGMALFPQHGDSYDELARNADAAMYAAKRAGRMQVRRFAGPDAEPEILAPVMVPGDAPEMLLNQ